MWAIISIFTLFAVVGETHFLIYSTISGKGGGKLGSTAGSITCNLNECWLKQNWHRLRVYLLTYAA